jgi:carbonic anhydrase
MNTKLYYKLFLILCVVTYTHTACPPWGYDDALGNGPAFWGDLCPEYANCNVAIEQSPINLVSTLNIVGQTDNLVTQCSTIHNFTFVNEDYSLECRDFLKSNTLSFLGLSTYTLLEFHFHAPSEHHIEGVQYPLEVHYVHADNLGNYAVLGFLYTNSDGITPTGPFLPTLAKYIPLIPSANAFCSVDALDIINITESA